MSQSILICDDDLIQSEYVEQLLKECPPWNQWPIIRFSSIHALLDYQEKLSAGSILLMDICLKDGNGIDAVAKLQTGCSQLSVIYITGEITYCSDVYETAHCGFLVKPVSLLKLRQALRRTQKNNGFTQFLSFQSGHKIIKIHLCDVLYFEKRLRKTIVFAKQGNFDFYGKFEELMPQLDRRMLRCHNSFIVNMDCVHQFDTDQFLLNNNALIPISRRRAAEVKKEFLQYLHIKNTDST